MNNYPKEITVGRTLDLKLGIKSSLPKVKSPIALLYFLWISSDKSNEVLYSYEKIDKNGNQYLEIEESVMQKMLNYMQQNNLQTNKNQDELKVVINSNVLLNSQIEALKVAFELVWKLANISFVDENLSNSAERQKIDGKTYRYGKKLRFSSVLDLIDLIVEPNRQKLEQCLVNWLMDENGDFDSEAILSKTLTILSDEAVYRIRIDEHNDIKFNMAGVYSTVSEKGDVYLADYKEAMGSLRILNSILREELNFFLKKRNKDASSYINKVDNNEFLRKYASRLSTYMELSNIDLSILDDGLSDNQIDSVNVIGKKKIGKPYQRIFFGAPGTGKSYQLNREAKEYFGNNFERVTFHPNYMYGNFVGAYKPFPKVLKENNGKALTDEYGNIQENITYKYVEGVLIRSLVKAFKNPGTKYLVIVEEINRANVAGVFGDIFQLLDRNGSGNSEYKIATSKELQEYLRQEFENEELDPTVKSELGKNFSSLFLPSNFYIWATMNSADQGVMPVDTAFRRRWDFTYLGIDEAVDESFNNYWIKISENEIAKWDDFRRAVNKKLSSCRIPEDKLIGPYFISKSVLETKNIDELTTVIRDKVLMYLYEDAAKAHRGSVFAKGKYDTYSSLCENFNLSAKLLFKDELKLHSTKTDNSNGNGNERNENSSNENE